MASILLLSEFGEGLSVAYRSALEGNLVKIYLKEGKLNLPAELKVTEITNPLGLLEQFDFILSDSPNLTDLSQRCEEKGLKLIGCTPFSHHLQNPPVQEKFLNLVYPGRVSKEPSSYFLTSWWTGQEFCPTLVSNLSFRLMEGEKGPIVGCAGSVSQQLTPKEDLLSDLIPSLRKDNYIGPLTLWLGPQFTIYNLHLGFHYDLTHAYLEGVKNLSTFLTLCKEGKPTHLREEYILTVRATSPQEILPQELKVDPEAWRHLHLTSLNRFCITGRGTTMNEARRRAYRTFQNLTLSPEVMYRLDIGKNQEDTFKEFSQNA